MFLFQISSILDVEIFCHFNRSLFHGLALSSSVSQQGLITTDKIYMVKRESFKKAKVRAQWHLQTMHISALRGGGQDYLDLLSLHASKFFGACLLVFFIAIEFLT